MTASRNGFSYSRYVRECIATRGVMGTAWHLLCGIFEVTRDYLPWRRRIRYGDIDFDWDCRVDTTWANLRLGTRLREVFTGRKYQPVDPVSFHEMMQALPLNPEDLAFIDLGSGKGRALLLASDYPFRKIIGVELLPELHAIAAENVKRYRSKDQRCTEFQLHHCDAREFQLPPEPLLIFLFDPFPEPILRQVVSQIDRSAHEEPRNIVIAYMNPVSHVLDESRVFRKLSATRQWALYGNG